MLGVGRVARRRSEAIHRPNDSRTRQTLALLGLALAYGYAAFFTMDQLLPPFMQRNPIWPSTFPKILSVLGIIAASVILLGLEKSEDTKDAEIDYRRLGEYKIGHRRSAYLEVNIVLAMGAGCSKAKASAANAKVHERNLKEFKEYRFNRAAMFASRL